MNKIKQWILDKFFKKEIDSMFAEAKMQGSKDSFVKARADLEEMMVETDKEKIEELANAKLASLLSVVDMSKIVKIDKIKKVVYIGDEVADAIKLSNLKAEAEFMTQSELFKLLYNTPKELAQRAMFVEGKDLADMQKGKSILYTLSNQQNIIDIFLSYNPK
jgi:hypothetical protein